MAFGMLSASTAPASEGEIDRGDLGALMVYFPDRCASLYYTLSDFSLSSVYVMIF